MQIQKMCLYDFDWQLLRVNLAFSTVEETRASIEILDEYLELAFDEEVETFANRHWRVLNLLNATLMGFNGSLKIAKSSAVLQRTEKKMELITEFRSSLQDAYHSRPKVFMWSLDVQREKLESAAVPDILKVYYSLGKRKKFASEYKKMPVQTTRPELLRYIRLIEEVLEARESEVTEAHKL